MHLLANLNNTSASSKICNPLSHFFTCLHILIYLPKQSCKWAKEWGSKLFSIFTFLPAIIVNYHLSSHYRTSNIMSQATKETMNHIVYRYVDMFDAYLLCALLRQIKKCSYVKHCLAALISIIIKRKLHAWLGVLILKLL